MDTFVESAGSSPTDSYLFALIHLSRVGQIISVSIVYAPHLPSETIIQGTNGTIILRGLSPCTRDESTPTLISLLKQLGFSPTNLTDSLMAPMPESQSGRFVINRTSFEHYPNRSAAQKTQAA